MSIPQRPGRPLFVGLVDDAALFPPGNAPMGEALAQHPAHRAAWYGEIVGPFLCPVSRLAELRAALDAAGAGPLDISLVLDTDADAALVALATADADHRLRAVMLEARHATLGEAAAALGAAVGRRPGVEAYLEAARGAWEATLTLAVAGSWHGAKYRTGGTSADAFPDAHELAGFLLAATRAGVPVKLTAGLHHAVRHTDPATGFEHHGFLNALLAVDDALAGRGQADLVATLEQRDGPALADRVRALTDDRATRVRRALRSFGCCGVDEPAADLRDLGLLTAEPAGLR